MRHLILVLVMFFGVGASAGYQPFGNGSTWPFGKEMSFPWTQISGVWQAQFGTAKSKDISYFVFKVGREIATGEKFVNVVQYDPDTCAILAQGPATLGIKSNKFVSGRIKGVQGEFSISVHAFRESDVKFATRIIVDDMAPVIVLKLKGYGSGQDVFSSQLVKVSDETDVVCN